MQSNDQVSYGLSHEGYYVLNSSLFVALSGESMLVITVVEIVNQPKRVTVTITLPGYASSK
ncbi:hypothetical protein SK58_03853 [Enterobacter sp. BIDMC93]|nr:hypothetical protein SK58_03853 [Enterobacter sp. BIDMC93]